jgi:hypothetical protein
VLLCQGLEDKSPDRDLALYLRYSTYILEHDVVPFCHNVLEIRVQIRRIPLVIVRQYAKQDNSV